MKETHTPRKDISFRRPKDSPSSKSIYDQSKKNQKAARKNLNSEFALVYEDSLLESVAEPFNLSQISEVTTDNNHIRESLDSIERLTGAENQSIVTTEDVSTQSESTPCSKITTVSNELVNLSPDRTKTLGSNNSFEVDVVVNLLKQARNQVICSNDVPVASKKLLDALVECSVMNIYTLPEEDRINWLLSNKLRVVIACSVVWLITTILFLLGCSRTRSSSSFNPPPT